MTHEYVYPIGENNIESLRTSTGRPLDEINLENLQNGQISAQDLQIDRSTLQIQAEVADRTGNKLLAENLYRAAELTRVPNDLLMRMYEVLRPNRTTYEALLNLADHLENEFEATRCAVFVREAARVYRERNLLLPEKE